MVRGRRRTAPPHPHGLRRRREIATGNNRGNALLTGTANSSYYEGAYPPYIVYAFESGNLVTQENNLNTYLLGSRLYRLETAYDAWRVMEVTAGKEVTLADQPPVGAPDARPTVWETGGHSVV